MTLELCYTVEAGEDLIRIWSHVAADSPRAAGRLLDTIETRCESLRDFPLMGPSRDDLRPGFRMLGVGEYIIVYRAMQGRVEIVRVLHGRRDLDDVFTVTE
ncbi:MAG: type II toxin-antitoxin system RelE/ParE family toxin [Hyphomonadaceae bacterium]|nr:type II toxin-antitoxin system RelE/ParE family toxin [Hyphomonadaceae bacterium]